ncbi:hypothetical protein T4C_10447 [Trichinella pseudospiralis]|uniref:Uncharacterized protein n=1 Tax=Trichinella pseudospiralis TaxID=6337 RepID=A0A0V1K1M9_TRIPS|nr:hypothetical protein T4D_15772 [Trichinella pseudospiralis]KRZ41102.1 hypothetical protein T4C_10447 [Trichinella pseudospiralis]
MPRVGLEIFKAGGDKGEFEFFPCTLSRPSAGFWSLKRGKPMLSAQKRWMKGDVAFCMHN